MAVYTEPPAVVTGQTMTATNWNSWVRTNFQAVWVWTTAGDLAYASAANQLSRLGIGAANRVLKSTGSAPIWDTMATLLQTVAMVTSQASGDLFYANGASSIARLGIGAAGKILRSTGSAPAWEGMRGAQVSRGASQSIPNASYTAASFPSETFDTAAFWAAGNPSRITIPRTGYYLIGGKIGWDANSNGVREVKLYRNGVDDDKKSVSQAALNGIATRMDLCFLVDATAGEYFELFLWQNSGGSLNHGGDTSYFWIFDVGI
jgi:hypothetical protein